ncbi:MAG: hypothetical protein MH137_10180 [Flavobacteriales bacterium]|nr:hypothetical protein [Flavobacteriales bacterium]
MDIERLKGMLHELENSVEKSQIPSETLIQGVSAADVKFLWSDYNKLLQHFKRHSDLFGEYREVIEPKPELLESKHTAAIMGYKFAAINPLRRQIQALKAVIEQNYL